MTTRRPIFVFGSNEKGIHGAGAALEARRRHGAILGCGRGLQGFSYAIPTKVTPYQPRALDAIQVDVAEFLDFARTFPDQPFLITPIGCGLAGYVPDQIGPLFKGAPLNCRFAATAWEKYR